MFEFITDFFKFKKKKEIKKPAVRTLPAIDPRRPLVETTEEESLILDSLLLIADSIMEEKEKISRSCAVCKFAKHDETLGERKEVICTVDPNKPQLKDSDDTCLKHELKYKGLKIIVDKGMLMEYDSEKAFSVKGDRIPETAITNIGEEEWQAQ